MSNVKTKTSTKRSKKKSPEVPKPAKGILHYFNRTPTSSTNGVKDNDVREVEIVQGNISFESEKIVNNEGEVTDSKRVEDVDVEVTDSEKTEDLEATDSKETEKVETADSNKEDENRSHFNVVREIAEKLVEECSVLCNDEGNVTDVNKNQTGGESQSETSSVCNEETTPKRPRGKRRGRHSSSESDANNSLDDFEKSKNKSKPQKRPKVSVVEEEKVETGTPTTGRYSLRSRTPKSYCEVVLAKSVAKKETESTNKPRNGVIKEKRKRKDKDVEVVEDDETEEDEDEDFVIIKQKQPKGQKKSSGQGKIDSFFTRSSVKKKKVDTEKLAFLSSGLPDAIIKAQKEIDQKKKEDDATSSMDLFPIDSHFGVDDIEHVFPEDYFEERPNGQELLDENCPDILASSWSHIFPKQEQNDWNWNTRLENGNMLINRVCCSDSNKETFNIICSEQDEDVEDKDTLPWVEKYAVTLKKKLVIDRKPFEKLETWMRHWKNDIKDDGGASRKFEKRRKRRDSSDSDFVTEDEVDEEFKRKSVLLSGPSGCGKTAAVYCLAKNLNFQIVEVNFSSQRSGKETLRRVEEAVLSQSLESHQSCLVLFKDIEHVYAKEDEGFYAAISQLVSASLRPIVMTTQNHVYSLIDPKLDSKDPLRLSFAPPSPNQIARKVLLPIIEQEAESHGLDVIPGIDTDEFISVLDSIARHSQCDIRRSINQIQLLFAPGYFSYAVIHQHMSHVLPWEIDFVGRSTGKVDEADRLSANDGPQDKKSGSTKAEKQKLIQHLDDIAKNLSLVNDFDAAMGLGHDVLDVFKSYACNERAEIVRCNYRTSVTVGMLHSDEDLNCIVNDIKHLTINTDIDLKRRREIDELNELLFEYCDDMFAPEDAWLKYGCVRTIVKSNVIQALRVAKRHGRAAFYFNRLDRGLVDKISNTLGFPTEHQTVKDVIAAQNS